MAATGACTRDPVAFVPARAGSKGAAGKNTRLLAGRPLYAHTIEQARAAGIAHIVISTDIPEILSRPEEPDIALAQRPAALAGDATTMTEVLLDWLDDTPDVSGPVVLLQPTSPLRRPAHIRAALSLWQQGAGDLVMSVTEADRRVLKWGLVEDGVFEPLGLPGQAFANRQALPPVWRPTGAVYVFGAAWLRRTRSLAAGRIAACAMDAADAPDIDTDADFAACEAELTRRSRP